MNASHHTLTALADKVNSAKSLAGEVLDVFPGPVDGRNDLEQAIGLLGQVEMYLDDAAEEAQR